MLSSVNHFNSHNKSLNSVTIKKKNLIWKYISLPLLRIDVTLLIITTLFMRQAYHNPLWGNKNNACFLLQILFFKCCVVLLIFKKEKKIIIIFNFPKNKTLLGNSCSMILKMLTFDPSQPFGSSIKIKKDDSPHTKKEKNC